MLVWQLSIRYSLILSKINICLSRFQTSTDRGSSLLWQFEFSFTVNIQILHERSSFSKRSTKGSRDMWSGKGDIILFPTYFRVYYTVREWDMVFVLLFVCANPFSHPGGNGTPTHTRSRWGKS